MTKTSRLFPQHAWLIVWFPGSAKTSSRFVTQLCFIKYTEIATKVTIRKGRREEEKRRSLFGSLTSGVMEAIIC